MMAMDQLYRGTDLSFQIKGVFLPDTEIWRGSAILLHPNQDTTGLERRCPRVGVHFS
jgi:hypothetical protein